MSLPATPQRSTPCRRFDTNSGLFNTEVSHVAYFAPFCMDDFQAEAQSLSNLSAPRAFSDLRQASGLKNRGQVQHQEHWHQVSWNDD